MRYDWRSPANKVHFGRDAGFDRGLVGEWRFSPATGLMLPDYSGYSNHGVITDCNWSATRYGPALAFGGAADHQVLISDSPELQLTTCSVCVFLKYNVIENTQNVAITKGSGTQLNYRISCNQPDGSVIEFRMRIGGAVIQSCQTSFAAQVGTWYHIVGTYDLTNLKIYANGALEDSEVHVGAVTTGAQDVYLGEDSGGSNRIKADIAHVRLYRRALTAPEVRARYQKCLARASGLASLWMLPLFGIPIGAQEYDVAMTLARQMGVTPAAGATAGGAYTLARSHGITTVADAQADAAITLACTKAITLAATATAQATRTLARIGSLTTVADATAGAGISLARQVDVASTADASADAAITLARTQALASEAALVFEVALTLARQMSLSTSAQVDAVAATVLALEHAIATLAEATAYAGVTLAIEEALALTATTTAAGQVLAACRALIVALESRASIVPTESRATTVPAESRAMIIPCSD